MTHKVQSARLSSGVTLPYVEQGDPDGVPLLLLHGPVDSWQAFELLLPHLPHDVRAIAVSQRGHGGADAPKHGYRPVDFAADAVAFLDALGVGAAVVAGHSGAGQWAIRCARDHPERVLGLVPIATPFTLRGMPGFAELLDTVGQLTDPVDPAFVREFVGTTTTPDVPPGFLEAVIAQSCQVPARVWQATLRGLLEADVPAGAVDRPTLLVWGERDEICGRGDQEALQAAIPGAELAAYPSAGHSPHWECPADVGRDIAAFVRTTRPLP